MEKKVLFVATVTSHINAFHIPYLKWFKDQGYEVHVASNGEQNIEYCDKHYNLPFERFPFKNKNLKCYKELKKIIMENQYKIIHCHTPVGGALTRIAARKARKNGTKVIYTAHGFHFYKGAPFINWLIYYPLEKWMAQYTDCLITINKEDYKLAKKNFKSNRIEYVHGVGLNTKKFDKIISDGEKEKIRKLLKIEKSDIVFTYVAELNKNKNQILLIETMQEIKKDYPNIKLLLVGNCNNKNYYQQEICKRNLENVVTILGKRNEINELLSITDIYLASSIREGLPVNIMEAMYKKLPIIATYNRGHRDLMDSVDEFLVKSEEQLIKKVIKLLNNNEIRKKLGEKNMKQVEKYKLNNVLEEMKEIYKVVF